MHDPPAGPAHAGRATPTYARTRARALAARLRAALALAVALAVVATTQAHAIESYLDWNHPYDKKETCLRLKNTSDDPAMHYADGSAVGTGYSVPNPTSWETNSDAKKCAQNSNEVRIDLTERNQVQPSGPHLYFHKGGQGYNPSTVPYGHLRLADLAEGQTPAPVISKSTLDSRGADPVYPAGAADATGYGNGRKCKAANWNNNSAPVVYKVTAPSGPPFQSSTEGTWVYKTDDVTGAAVSSGGNYAKYANGGAHHGTKNVAYQPLQWSHVGLHSWSSGGKIIAKRNDDPTRYTSGYGAERSILAPGTLVTRCDVASLTTRAYQANSNPPVTVGRVTAVYVKTSIGGNEIYGWLIHSWQRLKSGGNPATDGDYLERQCVLQPSSGSDGTVCPSSSPPPPPPPPSNNLGCCLNAGQTMYVDQYLLSGNGQYKLTVQQDGNLVEYGPNGAVWATGTSGSNARLVMQNDGNLVLYSGSGAVLWATNRFGSSARLVVQDDSNLVVYASSGVIWSRW